MEKRCRCERVRASLNACTHTHAERRWTATAYTNVIRAYVSSISGIQVNVSCLAHINKHTQKEHDDDEWQWRWWWRSTKPRNEAARSMFARTHICILCVRVIHVILCTGGRFFFLSSLISFYHTEKKSYDKKKINKDLVLRNRQQRRRKNIKRSDRLMTNKNL